MRFFRNLFKPDVNRIEDTKNIDALAGVFDRASDPFTRYEAVRAMGLLHDPAAITPLARAIEDSDETVRTAAVQALGMFAPQDYISLFAQATRDPEASVRAAAVQAIANYTDPIAHTTLLAAAKDAEATVRTEAIQALGNRDSLLAIETIIEATTDEAWEIREMAVDFLSELVDPRAVDAVIGASGDRDTNVRFAAIFALSKAESAKALPALIEMLSDDDWEIRDTVKQFLKESNAPEAHAALHSTQPLPKKESTLPVAPQPAQSITTGHLYNSGVSFFQKGQFQQALAAFKQCSLQGSYPLQASYAQSLCQQELGIEPSPQDQFDHDEDRVGTAFIASNVVCYLLGNGHRAALNGDSGIYAHIDGALYDIRVVSFFGTFMLNAWRKEGTQTIALADSEANPTPTHGDKFVLALLQDDAVLTPVAIPPNGLPTTLE